jgi:hypothetical protein
MILNHEKSAGYSRGRQKKYLLDQSELFDSEDNVRTPEAED